MAEGVAEWGLAWIMGRQGVPVVCRTRAPYMHARPRSCIKFYMVCYETVRFAFKG